MSKAQKRLVWFALFYAVFWLGGNYSFTYTHTCARSHQEERFDNQGDSEMVTVCDYYTANGKRWTSLDPVRSVATTWITSWTDAAVLGAIALAIGGYMWNERRKRAEEAMGADYASYPNDIDY